MDRYVGLDAHAQSCTLGIVSASGQRLKSLVVEMNGHALADAVRSISGRVHLCLEEGTQSAWLHELLKPHAAEIVVAMAPQTKRAKDGKRDAWARANELRLGTIETRVYKAPQHLAGLRNAVRAYGFAVTDVVRAKNRLKAVFLSRGIRAEAAVYDPKRRSAWLKKLPVPHRQLSNARSAYNPHARGNPRLSPTRCFRRGASSLRQRPIGSDAPTETALFVMQANFRSAGAAVTTTLDDALKSDDAYSGLLELAGLLAGRSGGVPGALSHEEEVVHTLTGIDLQVSNGGWLQWLYNTEPWRLGRAVADLRELGLQSVADIAEKVLQLGALVHSGTLAAKDKDAILSRLPDSSLRELSLLDGAFYGHQDECARTARSYVLRHRAAFEL